MTLHGPVFISYEPVDGLDAALWIAECFGACTPPVPCWIAERNVLDPNAALYEVTEAVQACSCFILVATNGAVTPDARAKQECRWALKYKKPMIVAAIDDCELPPYLMRRPQMTIKLSIPGTFEALRGTVLSTTTLEG